jgi:hypothetical protein
MVEQARNVERVRLRLKHATLAASAGRSPKIADDPFYEVEASEIEKNCTGWRRRTRSRPKRPIVRAKSNVVPTRISTNMLSPRPSGAIVTKW